MGFETAARTNDGHRPNWQRGYLRRQLGGTFGTSVLHRMPMQVKGFRFVVFELKDFAHAATCEKERNGLTL